MTPDALRVRLSRLLREAAVDRAAMSRIAEELALYAPRLAASTGDRPLQALVAVDLHDYYTAAETLFERVARHLDGDVPTGSDWHRALLVQMAADIPGLRAAVLGEAELAWLDRLRGFRHFFRHAYAVTLDVARLQEHADAILSGHGALLGRVDDLLAQVDAARQDTA